MAKNAVQFDRVYAQCYNIKIHPDSANETARIRHRIYRVFCDANRIEKYRPCLKRNEIFGLFPQLQPAVCRIALFWLDLCKKT